MIIFKGKHFLNPIIRMSVLWYVAYALNYRDVEKLLLEMGLRVEYSTVNRWPIEYAPQLPESFKTNKKLVGGSWSADKNYVKVKGVWMCQYCAVDKDGNTVYCYFYKSRDKNAAAKFFFKSMCSSGKPVTTNINKSRANTSALTGIELHHMLRKGKHINAANQTVLEQFYALAA